MTLARRFHGRFPLPGSLSLVHEMHRVVDDTTELATIGSWQTADDFHPPSRLQVRNLQLDGPLVIAQSG